MNKLICLLPKLVKLVKNSHGKSIMSHIYGIYKVELSGFHSINLVLQRNCLKVTPGNRML